MSKLFQKKILNKPVLFFSEILSEEIGFKNAPATVSSQASLSIFFHRVGSRSVSFATGEAQEFARGKFGIFRLSHQNRGVKKNGLASAGFTLIETIVALAVITSAIVGPFTLATKGILHVSFAKNKLVAANLSQEGVELTRKIRENNILAGRNWDAGISAGSWQADIFSSDLSPFSGVPMLFESATGIYSQTNGSPTLFIRKITIAKPSADEIDVVSEVSWTDRNIDRRVVLSEKLYNWR